MKPIPIQSYLNGAKVEKELRTIIDLYYISIVYLQDKAISTPYIPWSVYKWRMDGMPDEIDVLLAYINEKDHKSGYNQVILTFQIV